MCRICHACHSIHPNTTDLKAGLNCYMGPDVCYYASSPSPDPQKPAAGALDPQSRPSKRGIPHAQDSMLKHLLKPSTACTSCTMHHAPAAALDQKSMFCLLGAPHVCNNPSLMLTGASNSLQQLQHQPERRPLLGIQVAAEALTQHTGQLSA